MTHAEIDTTNGALTADTEKKRIVVITGANSGIGLATAKALASRGDIVIMACRNAKRATEALREVLDVSKNDTVQAMSLDLASLRSVQDFAQGFQSQFDHLDILINNAGIFPPQKQLTQEGFEMQYGVNHLGHFALTKLLLPKLKAAGQARVITVASMMHRIGKLDFNRLHGEGAYNPLLAYGQSKLANVLFSRELASRYGSQGITAYSLHPGGVATNIAGRSRFRRTAYRFLGGYFSAERGAKTSLHLANAPLSELQNGGYYNEFCRLKSGSKRSQDVALAEKLWLESEKSILPYLVEPQWA